MRDVARAAGVSRMTVSRALKKESSVSQETRERILKFVHEMNYVPDQIAGSLTTGKSGFVGVLLPSLNNLHFALTVQALTECFESENLQLLVGCTAYDRVREEHLVQTLLRRRPEAMILSYDGHTERTISLLKDAPIPIVEIWETPEDPIDHTVGFSNAKAAFTMAQALLGRGFKNIVFLGEENDDWTRGASRRSGFLRAMTDAGITSPAQLRYGTPPLSIENGAMAAELLVDQFPQADCVFCVSDMAAYGMLSGLRKYGKRVPEDISLVGFGNFEVSRFCVPTLSTVMVDPVMIGREAGRLVTRLLNQETEALDNPRHIYVEPSIEFRDSCPV